MSAIIFRLSKGSFPDFIHHYDIFSMYKSASWIKLNMFNLRFYPLEYLNECPDVCNYNSSCSLTQKTDDIINLLMFDRV